MTTPKVKVAMGARLDLYRKQTEQVDTVFAAALRGTANSSDLTKPAWAKGVLLTLDITAKAGTSPTLDLKVQGKDPVSGKYYDIPGAAWAQKNDSGVDELTVYPGMVEAANVSEDAVLPQTWRMVGTVGGSATPTFTYSVGADYLP